MELVTQRLHLRELRSDDFDALHAILSDSETMAHYPAPFSEEKRGGGSNGIWKTIAPMASACGRWS